MKMKLFLLVMAALPFCVTAQQKNAAVIKYTISGFVKDSLSGETLIGATVAVNGKTKGISSNQYGFYSLTLEAGDYIIACSFIGYQPKLFYLKLDGNKQLNMQLLPKVNLSQEVIVSTKKRDANVRNAQMGKFTLPIEQIKTIPAFLGEVDLLKTIQLLPGIRNAGEGSAGLYVRGGGPDQNLIILDDAPVYNVSHLFGFFSVFNGDALKSVELTKGGFPARFGGRLSSVLELNMKEGNKEKLHGEGGGGLPRAGQAGEPEGGPLLPEQRLPRGAADVSLVPGDVGCLGFRHRRANRSVAAVPRWTVVGDRRQRGQRGQRGRISVPSVLSVL